MDKENNHQANGVRKRCMINLFEQILGVYVFPAEGWQCLATCKISNPFLL